MKSFRVLNRQTGSLIAVIALVAAVVAPTIASAAQLTERSIALSNSSKTSTNVSYTVDFTSVSAAGAFIIDFCSNTPLIGEACTAPGGFSASSATTATPGFTRTVIDANTVKVTGTIGATSPITVALDGITNPSAVGPMYARIITYDTDANADTYVDAQTLGSGVKDQGSAAINITDSIGVSAAVLESMTFCVSKNAIDVNCTNTVAPTLKLGETTGTVIALDANHVSTGDLYTQISTNAVTGAVVSLKSNATGCGGLLRAGAPGACDIAPAQKTGIAFGEAKFGVKVSSATSTTGVNDATGVYQPVAGSGYNTSTYALNYNGTTTGVTSPYGDPFLDTNNLPVNNKNVTMTFGASISNSTPAGLYSADLGLIATGKF